MPRWPAKPAPEPLPEHLERLIALLEAQDTPLRSKAIRQVEAEFPGIEIDLDEALAEHEAFADRYRRWRRRLDLDIEDRADAAVLAGKASAGALLRGRGQLRAAGPADSARGGRVTLDRQHRGQVDRFRKGW